MTISHASTVLACGGIFVLSFAAIFCILVCGTVAGSGCSTLVKTMPDVDVLLSQIAR
jgi:hypothetical protein